MCPKKIPEEKLVKNYILSFKVKRIWKVLIKRKLSTLMKLLYTKTINNSKG